jgi:hypothetical protein
MDLRVKGVIKNDSLQRKVRMSEIYLDMLLKPEEQGGQMIWKKMACGTLQA